MSRWLAAIDWAVARRRGFVVFVPLLPAASPSADESAVPSEASTFEVEIAVNLGAPSYGYKKTTALRLTIITFLLAGSHMVFLRVSGIFGIFVPYGT
jgi:hypothetical protein